MNTTPNLRAFGLFDAKVPRFTSFPPANWFTEAVSGPELATWRRATPKGERTSLYVHIPFCRRLCWFCACRTQGTKTDAPLGRYVAHILVEAERVRREFAHDLSIARLHLGGGTPTILPPNLLTELLSGLDEIFGLHNLDEFSAEIDPTDVDAARIAALRKFGLSRASLGIQDFDTEVQDAIGRIQPFDMTQEVVNELRTQGIDNINFDLLYGLPKQDNSSLLATLEAALSMQPDRLALFGYAHVPWMSKRQMMIPRDALPSPEARYGLFQTARKHLLGRGHLQIGIDHFALPSDGLARAFIERRLKRSFQGYTDDPCTRLVAIGASAISTYPEGFAQNIPVTGKYAAAIEGSQSPVWRGFALSGEDKIKARVVEELLCYHRADVSNLPDRLERALLRVLHGYPGTMERGDTYVTLKPWAQPLVRIIAAEFALGTSGKNTEKRYSRAI